MASATVLIALGIPFTRIRFISVDARVLPASASARQVNDVAEPRSSRPTAPRRCEVVVGAPAGSPAGADAGGPDRSAAGRLGGRAARSPAGPRNVAALGRSRRTTRSATPPSSWCATSARIHEPFYVGVAGQTRRLRRPRAQPRRPPAGRAGGGRRRHADRAVPDDRLGGAADQGGADERAQPERGVRDPRADLPGRQPPGPARLPQRGGARRHPADLPVRGRASGWPPTTACSCSPGSRRRATAAPRTPRRWRSGSSGPGGSSPPRRCCSRWRSARSPPRKLVFIKELGLGAALAVLIDASIIRALLVPSLMELLGTWNWWAPRPLRRLHERIGLREGPPPGCALGPDLARRDPDQADRAKLDLALGRHRPLPAAPRDPGPVGQPDRGAAERGSPHSVAISGRSPSGTSPSPRRRARPGR